MHTRFISFLILLSLPLSIWAEDTSLFQQGNEHYAEGDFQQAVETYEKALAEHQSANLHYNLGNAYYQLGDYGRAILHFEKALALDPRNPDFRANLELTQEAAQLTPAAPSWTAIIAGLAPVNGWAWLAAISFWALIILCFIAPLYRWKGPLRGGLITIAALLLLTSSVALYGWHVRGSYGVVLTDQTTLSVAPTSSSPPAGSVKAGQLARIRETHGDYYLVTVDDKIGWLPNQAFSPVWD